MYMAPKAAPLALPSPVDQVEAVRDLPYFKVGYGSFSFAFFDEKTGARINNTSDSYVTPYSGGEASKFAVFPVRQDKKTWYELRLKDGGGPVPLPQRAVQITFVEGTPYLLIVYESGNCELRRVDDGSAIPVSFTARVEGLPLFGEQQGNKIFANVEFSPDLTTFAIVTYHGGAVFRAPTGEKLGALSTGEFVSPSEIIFSPDSSRFLVDYQNHAPELRRSDTGAVIKQLSVNIDSRDDIVFNKHSTCFVATRPDGSLELLRADSGEALAPIAGGPALSSVNFIDDGNYALMLYADSKAELWRTGSVLRRAAELERNLAGHLFDEANNQLLVWHSDKRAYILDLAWVSGTTADSGRLPFRRVLQSFCEAHKRHPLPQGVLDRYLNGEEPRACR
jgi:hypothetical protein